MAVDTKPNLQGRAETVRTETQEKQNTSQRVGSLFRDIVDTVLNGETIASLYHAVNNVNAFTDSLKTKLEGINTDNLTDLSTVNNNFAATFAAVPHIIKAPYRYIYADSDAGNDANSGRLSTTPVQTANQINTIISNLPAGEIPFLMLKRGSNFAGQIDLLRDGNDRVKAVIDSYGDNLNLPVIDGGQTITGTWTNVSANVWKIALASGVTDLYRRKSGESSFSRMTIARDITGTHTIASGSTRDNGSGQAEMNVDNTNITQTISEIVGTRVVMRLVYWQWDTATVVAASDNVDGTWRLTLDDEVNVVSGFRPGYGVYFVGESSFVDSADEWAYDATAQELYIYSTTDPNSDGSDYKYPVRDYGVNLGDAREFVEIKNIHASYQKIANVRAGRFGNGANSAVRYVDLHDSTLENSDFGAHFRGTFEATEHFEYCTLKNLTVRNQNTGGLYVPKARYNVYENNDIRNIFLWGAHRWDAVLDVVNLPEGFGEGLSMYTSNGEGTGAEDDNSNVARGNYFENLGGGAIYSMGKNNEILENKIRNVCQNKSDWAAVYTWGRNTRNTQIIKNDIRGVRTSSDGVNGSPINCMGIYNDDFQENPTNIGNLIYDADGTGIQFNANVIGLKCQRNYIVECGTSILLNDSKRDRAVEGTASLRPYSGVLLTDNVIINTTNDNLISLYRDHDTSIAGLFFGVTARNKYYASLDQFRLQTGTQTGSTYQTRSDVSLADMKTEGFETDSEFVVVEAGLDSTNIKVYMVDGEISIRLQNSAGYWVTA